MVPVVAAGLLLAGPAAAHDDAMWVETGGYKDKAGVPCCGEKDCRVAGPGVLKRIPGGWLHVPTQTSVKDDDPGGVYPSIDAQLWECDRGGELKCVFWGMGT